jgi:NADH-quinone oxidoreductase subunit G
VPDLEWANAVLLLDCDPIDDAPVLDLRIRKGVRRHGLKVFVASARPTALDPSAKHVLRTAPGGAGALLVALDAALSGDKGSLGGAATAAGSSAGAVSELLDALSAEDELVIVYGERALTGDGARALLNVAARLGLRDRAGAGLLELPASANARGLREAGFAPGHGPGYASVAEPGLDAHGIAEGLAAGELAAVWLQHADPLRTHPDRALWERALDAAQSVIAVESVLTDTVREYADVVFPAEAYAEKEGTLVHPDGRLQRLRMAIGRPKGRGGMGVGGSKSGVRAGWQVIADVARGCGLDLGVLSGPMASRQLFDAVPFYAGLTLEEIGGRGLRWPERGRLDVPAWEPVKLEVPGAPAGDGAALRLGTFRSLWASKEVDVSPALRFLRARQVVELSPADAERLGIHEGDRVEVGSNGTRVRGAVKLRAAIPGGSVFIAEGTREEPANVLVDGAVEVRRIGGPPPAEPSAVAAQVAPAAEGLAEPPPSAPLPLPGEKGPE